MKIGILSMQRIYNYGSFLQSYALKTTLERMGHSVGFVDIERSSSSFSLPKKSKAQKMLEKTKYFDKYLIKRIDYSKKNTEMNIMFRSVQQKYFGIDPNVENSSAEGFDAVAIGSDEIFNCEPNSQWGVTGQRFGDIPGAITFSYAASCGYTEVKDITPEDSKIILSALKKLKGISVRDNNTNEFVKHFLGKDAEFNLDPVLIYSFEKEISEAEKTGLPDKPYMIVYAYHNRIEAPEEIKAIKNYAKKNGLTTIAIGGSLPWCDEFAVIEPFQVLAYFKNAKCIVTDTFHGTVMASKLNKPLGVLIRESNKNKLGDLLDRLEIRNHEINSMDKLEAVLDQTLDYGRTNEIIKNGQKRALEYLERILFRS